MLRIDKWYQLHINQIIRLLSLEIQEIGNSFYKMHKLRLIVHERFRRSFNVSFYLTSRRQYVLKESKPIIYELYDRNKCIFNPVFIEYGRSYSKIFKRVCNLAKYVFTSKSYSLIIMSIPTNFLTVLLLR